MTLFRKNKHWGIVRIYIDIVEDDIQEKIKNTLNGITEETIFDVDIIDIQYLKVDKFKNNHVAIIQYALTKKGENDE